jgi:hypothetical protein
MSGPIGYLKYSSSEDEDSTSEKSLYFRDMIEENKTTEEYLDEVRFQFNAMEQLHLGKNHVLKVDSFVKSC